MEPLPTEVFVLDFFVALPGVRARARGWATSQGVGGRAQRVDSSTVRVRAFSANKIALSAFFREFRGLPFPPGSVRLADSCSGGPYTSKDEDIIKASARPFTVVKTSLQHRAGNSDDPDDALSYCTPSSAREVSIMSPRA